MKIEVLGSYEQLDALEPEWLALWAACPRSTPFQSPQWLLPWTKHLYGGGRICSLALRQDGRLAGFAPLFEWGTDTKTVSFLSAGISDYGDVLFAPGKEAECVAAVREFLTGAEFADAVVDLQELRSDSGLLELGGAEPCSICPVLDLATFPGSMDSKHRTDVRRARNKLLKLPGVQFELATPATSSNVLQEFFSLHAARWGMMTGELQQFHGDVVQRSAATGHLRLAVVRLEERPLAAIYAFRSGTTLYCYLSGFDPENAKLSPGAVLLGWLIEQAAAEGITEVDFLRDGEAYKYLWGARDRTNFVIRQAGGR